MRKVILKWLFGVDNIEDYFNTQIEYLDELIRVRKEYIKASDRHLETIDVAKEALNNIMKLIKICENHNIDVDEEIKHIEL